MFEPATNQTETAPPITLNQASFLYEKIYNEIWDENNLVWEGIRSWTEERRKKLLDALEHLTSGKYKYLLALWYNKEYERLNNEILELSA